MNQLLSVSEDEARAMTNLIELEAIRRQYSVMSSEYSDCPDAIRPSFYWEDRLLWDGDQDVCNRNLENFRRNNLIIKNLPDHTQSFLGRMRSWFFIRNRYLALKREFPNSDIDRYEEDTVGNPCLARYKGKAMTYRFVRFFYHLELLRRVTNLSDRERLLVVEIGSGYGGFAKWFKTFYPNSTYVLIDLPELLLLSTYYLSRNFPKSKFCLYEGKRKMNFNNKSDLLKYDFVTLPQWAISSLPGLSTDLFINQVSFQEMKPEGVAFYMNEIQRQATGYLFLINRDEKSLQTGLKKMKVNDDVKVRFDDYPFDDRWNVLLKRPCPFLDITYGGPVIYPRHPLVIQYIAKRLLN